MCLYLANLLRFSCMHLVVRIEYDANLKGNVALLRHLRQAKSQWQPTAVLGLLWLVSSALCMWSHTLDCSLYAGPISCIVLADYSLLL